MLPFAGVLSSFELSVCVRSLCGQKTVVAEYAIAMVFRENAARRAELERLQLQQTGLVSSVTAADTMHVIYCSPIKALSNQKYREFKEIFSPFGDEVGLVTGDVILQPNATCIIMTTEILRSMIYNGNEILNRTVCVIFDEIHYMKDTERGIVWEESIIMLDPHIQCVFLSATLANATQFAEWIHHIKCTPNAHQSSNDSTADAPSASSATAPLSAAAGGVLDSPFSASASSTTTVSAEVYHRAACHVVYTELRPVPLVHYICLKGGQGLYQIKNDKARADKNAQTFSASNLAKIRAELQQIQQGKGAISSLVAAQYASSLDGSSPPPSSLTPQIQQTLASHRAAKLSATPDIIRLLLLASAKDWLPLIVFSFARRECEHLSLVAGSKKYNLDFTSAEEKESIQLIWDKAMAGVSKEDLALPQLSSMLPFLLRGIAVHHSGLLPLLKELIEILFQERLIKVLFATETFALGLNMPTRGVIFTQIKKFDGMRERYLQASEYIQMAGRAGRRNLDEKGIVIIMLEPKDLMATSNTPTTSSSALTPNDASGPAELGGVLHDLLLGTSDPLASKFRLTYNMILNLIRFSSTFHPTHILTQSFLHFQQTQLLLPQHEEWSSTPDMSTTADAPLTSVSKKHQQRGITGIASSALTAAGADAVKARATARTGVKEMQHQLEQVQSQIRSLNLSKADCTAIVDYAASFAKFQSLQQEQYELSQRFPLQCILPFLQSGRVVFVSEPARASQNTTATSESRAAKPAVNWGWGIVVNWRKRHTAQTVHLQSQPPTDQDASAGSAPSSVALPPPIGEYAIDILLPTAGVIDSNSISPSSYIRWGDVLIPLVRESQPQCWQQWENGTLDIASKPTADRPEVALTPPYHIVHCSTSMIRSISSIRVYLPSALMLAVAATEPPAQLTRHALFTVMHGALQKFTHQMQHKIRPIDWLQIAIEDEAASSSPSAPASASRGGGTDELLQQAWSAQRQRCLNLDSQLVREENNLVHSPVHQLSVETINSYLRLRSLSTALTSRLGAVQNNLSSTQLLSYRIELHSRLRILRRFQHITPDGLITRKGRVAASIDCADELLCTEVLYEGHWKGLNHAEVIALCACLIECERSSADRLPIPTPGLATAFQKVQEIARRIAAVSNECDLQIDPARYVASFRHDLIPLVHAWISRPSLTFAELVAMSSLFEGTLVRVFRRLDEFLNQIIAAASQIGDTELTALIQQGQTSMKRGIIFGASLYI